MVTETYHLPVLSEAVIAGLHVKPGGHYLDVTVGGGGHSQLILQAAPDITLVAIDRDAQAIAVAQTRLAHYALDQVQFWQGNFADFDPEEQRFDGIIADLGVSSAQLDRPERGFSFRHEAPLDMRMDRHQPLTAAELINHRDERELADLFFHYGEERYSRRIARRLVEQRPFTTTTALAAAIAQAVPKKYRYGRIHPATRVFQALRIAVNQELAALEQLLSKTPHWLKPAGYLGIISFHSLEDRRVKHFLRQCPDLEVITKKPLVADDMEIQTNPRARSAKLRFAQRVMDLNQLP